MPFALTRAALRVFRIPQTGRRRMSDRFSSFAINDIANANKRFIKDNRGQARKEGDHFMPDFLRTAGLKPRGENGSPFSTMLKIFGVPLTSRSS